MSWKEISAIEDVMMLKDHCILLGGDSAAARLSWPKTSDLRKFYKVRELLLKDRNTESLSPLSLAKNIVTHARECFYLWYGDYKYDPLDLYTSFRANVVGFCEMSALEDAVALVTSPIDEYRSIKIGQAY